MHLYPSDIYEKLEFDKILNLLSGYCIGEPAKKIASSMRCYTNASKIENLLDEILNLKDLKIDNLAFHYQYMNPSLSNPSCLEKMDMFWI